MLTINVTQEHIEKGIQCDTGNCPIALAIKEAIPDVVSISVDDEMITYRCNGEEKHVYFRTPSEAENFIVAFDNQDDVAPFNFQL